MKSIIFLSTIIFTGLSFLGIASYYRYNASLRADGLYAPPKPKEIKQTDPVSPVLQQETPEELYPQNEIPQANPEPPQHNTQTTKKPVVKKKQTKEPVVASKRKVERDIDFKDFSRAPMNMNEIEEPTPEVIEVKDETEPLKDPE